MIEILIAIIGASLAGIWDLKTTEVPEEIPYLMILSGIVIWFVNAVSTGDFYPLFLSLFSGISILAAGLILYSRGYWGEADAWILAAIAFMIPVYSSIFMINFLPNLVIVSALYMILYTIILGLRNKKIFSLFINDMKNNWKIIIAVPFVYLAVLIVMFNGKYNIAPALNTFLLIVLLMVFWRYGTVIEKNLFRKTISAGKLKPGDVLVDMKWVGLTEDEIKKLKKTKKYVTIKDGIRFIPVFPLALVTTILYGNLFLMFL